MTSILNGIACFCRFCKSRAMCLHKISKRINLGPRTKFRHPLARYWMEVAALVL